MSELLRPGGRRQRADARRSVAVILDAATALLGEQPAASMEDIAAAAGVTRQTVYAHFTSRDVLLAAVVDRITAEVLTVLDAVDVDHGPAGAALANWLDACWGLLERYPVLLSAAIPAGSPEQERDRHQPITDRLLRLIRRGRRTGEFDRRLSTGWLVAATMALGHAAGQEVSAGRMSSSRAGAAFRDGVMRVYGVEVPAGHRAVGPIPPPLTDR